MLEKLVQNRILSRGAAFGSALLATACVGMGDGVKTNSNIVLATSVPVSAVLENHEEDYKPVTAANLASGVTTHAYEQAMIEIAKIKSPGFELNPLDPSIDELDGQLREQTPTRNDILVARFYQIAIPDNFSIQGSDPLGARDLIGRLDLEDIKTIENSGYNPRVRDGGFVAFNSDNYVAIPLSNGRFFEALKIAARKDIESMLGDVGFSNVTTYHLKQGKNRIGEVTLYERENLDGILRPKVTLEHNGYRFSPTLVLNEDLEGIDNKRTVAYVLEDNAGGRYVVTAAITAGCAVASPPLALGCAAVNLYLDNESGKVVDAKTNTEQVPPLELGEYWIIGSTQSRDGSSLQVFQPIYVQNSPPNLVGLAHYNLDAQGREIVVTPREVYVPEDGKFLAGIAEKGLVAAGIIGPFLYGRSEAETAIKQITPTRQITPAAGHDFTGGNFLPGPPLPPGTR